MQYGRVLLADQHLGMLEGVHSLLDALFKTVLMVADEPSLQDAIAVFQPDLVVVDLSLPREVESASTADRSLPGRLMERYPDLRLIVLSVYDEPTIVRQTLRHGVAGFVLKRAVGTDLVPAVEEVLRGGVFAPRQTRRRRSGAQLPRT